MKILTGLILSIPLALIGFSTPTCARGTCNVYGCSSCGVCTVYGCPQCGGNNSNRGYGGYRGYRGYGGYGRNGGGGNGGATQTCNVYGCGVSPNVYGTSPNGVCTVYGCP